MSSKVSNNSIAENEEKVYYFAFGSNMNPARMSERGVSFTGQFGAKLRGYRLAFNKVAGFSFSTTTKKEGYANIVKSKATSVVEGIVYETNQAGIAALDKFEGVPVHYYKAWALVETQEGKTIEALVYVAQPSKTHNGLKPGREYLDHLLVGKEFLSPEYYARLENWETAPARTAYPKQSAFNEGFGNKWGTKTPQSYPTYRNYRDEAEAEVEGAEIGLEEEDEAFFWSEPFHQHYTNSRANTSSSSSKATAGRRERGSKSTSKGEAYSTNTSTATATASYSNKVSLLEVLSTLDLEADLEAQLFEEAANYRMTTLEFLRYVIEEGIQRRSYGR